jgi:DNA-binding NtrC family response regulator
MESKMKILILEDNKSDAEFVQYELEKSGMIFTPLIVQTAETYENALDNFRPNIILSDYSLPSFDGISAFQMKQKKCPDIPFIIVSGVIGEENAVQMIKNGVDDYALKDKLFSLPHKITRALKDAEERKNRKIGDEKLRIQYEKIMEIAIMQSHQVRAPIANILGLVSLIKIEKISDPDNVEILEKLKTSTLMFDNVIRKIVQKTNEISKI